MAHMARCKPAKLQELKEVVEDFAINFDPGKARAMARHTTTSLKTALAKDVS